MPGRVERAPVVVVLDEITKLGVKLLCESWSRKALVVAHYLVNVRIDLRMKDKPHQLRRLSIRWSSSSNVMPRDGFASNSASRRRASAIPSSSSCRTDGSDPSRCAARTALSVSGKSSASFSTSAMVAIGASLVSTASKARTHQKTATVYRKLPAPQGGSALQVLPLEDVRPRFRSRYIRVHPHCGHTKTVQ